MTITWQPPYVEHDCPVNIEGRDTLTAITAKAVRSALASDQLRDGCVDDAPGGPAGPFCAGRGAASQHGEGIVGMPDDRRDKLLVLPAELTEYALGGSRACDILCHLVQRYLGTQGCIKTLV